MEHRTCSRDSLISGPEASVFNIYSLSRSTRQGKPEREQLSPILIQSSEYPRWAASPTHCWSFFPPPNLEVAYAGLVLPFSFVCFRRVFFGRLAVAAAPFALCWINLHPFQRLWIWSISALSSPVNPDNLKCPFVSWRFYHKSSPSFNSFPPLSQRCWESDIGRI